MVEHKIKVTRIGNGWNVRLFVNGVLSSELRVYNRHDIGVASRELLRTSDKIGQPSQYSQAMRHRTHKREIFEYIGKREIVNIKKGVVLNGIKRCID